MRQLWDDAAKFYFHPTRFGLALQNCITTSRTVTFILQSNKAEIPDFEEWYRGYQDKWAQDPIMRWAKEARNSIEKRGDLETYSQVKAAIIASYIGGPETEWMPQSLFLSPLDVWRTVPKNLRADPQVFNHGTLVIERRWVDSGLPEVEVLEALAHVYMQFKELIKDLCNRLALPLLLPLDASDSQSMQPMLMDRALYLSIKDGSEVGLRLFHPTMEVEVKTLRKRYGKTLSGWQALRTAKDFKEVCEVFFSQACAMMLRDHHHRAFAFLFKGIEPLQMIGMDHPDRASRYVLIRELAQLAKIIGADGVMLISEAWTAKSEDAPNGYAVEAPNKGEALLLHAANASGVRLTMAADVTRKKNKKHKVKSIKRRQDGDGGFQYILAPFLQAWDCLDHDEIELYQADHL